MSIAISRKFVRASLVASLALGSAFGAQAVSYCNSNSASTAAALSGPFAPTEGIAVSDVRYNGSDSENCYGVTRGTGGAGNDDATTLNTLGAFGQSNWVELARSNVSGSTASSDSGTFTVGATTYTFTLQANDGGGGWDSGGWTLGVTPLVGLPIFMDFVVALKGSTGFALYLFDDVAVNASNAGTWTMKILTPNGRNIADLSHLTLYARLGEGGGGDDDEIPEPATLALMGLALGGLGLTRRRRGRA